MPKSKRKILFLCLCLIPLVACGGRLPSSSRATSLIRKHFNKYGKEYDQSPFANKKVTNVEVLSINEIHKHLVTVQSFITLSDQEVYKVRVTLEKKAFGWKYISWENLGGD